MPKIVTWNVAGIQDKIKRGLVHAEIRSMRADVCFLQETHCGEDSFDGSGYSQSTADQWQIEWGGTAFYNPHSKSKGGTAILFRKGLRPKFHQIDLDPQGAYVRVACEMGGVEYTLVSVYVPSEQTARKKFLREVMPGLLQGDNLILGGDINCVLNGNLDVHSRNQYPSATVGREILMQAMDGAGVVDAFRMVYPTQRMYSRWGWGGQRPARLDRHLVSTNVLQHITKIYKITAPLSDHSPVMMVLDSGNEMHKGSGWWKLNTSLMDSEGCKQFREMWEEWQVSKCTHHEGIDGWFAEGIEKARALFQKIGKERAQERRAQEKDFRTQVCILDRMATAEPDNTEYTAALAMYHARLKESMTHKARGARIRAKEHDDHMNETCSAWFFGQEKARGGCFHDR